MNELATIDPSASLKQLVLNGRNPNTIRAYSAAMDHFAQHLGIAESFQAIQHLIAIGHGNANAVVAQYRATLLDAKLSPATINARLGAIRSIVKDARRFGMVNWSLDVPSVSSEQYRDTRGPGQTAYTAMVNAAGSCIAKSRRARDVMILRMLHDMGLRRGELTQIDMSDLDVENSRVLIKGKGRTEKSPITVPRATMEVVKEWLSVRGGDPGPLVTSLDRNPQNRSKRLTGKSIHKIVAGYGETVGVKTRPHGLRHQAITTALDKTNGDVRRVRQFSRHKKLETLMIYDDHRKDEAGAIGDMLATVAM